MLGLEVETELHSRGTELHKRGIELSDVRRKLDERSVSDAELSKSLMSELEGEQAALGRARLANAEKEQKIADLERSQRDLAASNSMYKQEIQETHNNVAKLQAALLSAQQARARVDADWRAWGKARQNELEYLIAVVGLEVETELHNRHVEMREDQMLCDRTEPLDEEQGIMGQEQRQNEDRLAELEWACKERVAELEHRCNKVEDANKTYQKEISEGHGVVAKLQAALVGAADEPRFRELQKECDTLADMVIQLQDENRVLQGQVLQQRTSHQIEYPLVPPRLGK